MLDKVLPAITGLVGAALGVIAFLLVGWTEGQKQYQIRKAEAYVEFASRSWGGATDNDQWAFTRAVSGLTVYADEPVLVAFGRYNAANCSSHSDEGNCKELWAQIVNSMRLSIGQKPAASSAIIQSLWGS